MFNKAFLIDLGERAIATFAQALAAVFVAAGTGLLDTDYVTALSVAGMAALLAILKGLGAFAKNKDTGASLGTAIPRPQVAAVEEEQSSTGYAAEEASEYPPGLPVDVEAKN